MTPAERVDIAELIRCAANMREAANNLWWAHNPDRLHGEDDSKEPPTLEDAQEAHADAFRALQRAEWYAQRVLDRDARASASAGPVQTNIPKGAVSVVKPQGTEETGTDRPALA